MIASPLVPGQQTVTDRFQSDVLDVPGITHVIIMAGINDCGRAQITATMLANALQALMNRATAAGITAHVCTLAPMLASYSLYSEMEPMREATNALLRQYYPGGPPTLFDIAKVMIDPGTAVAQEIFLMGNDGLHPNFSGDVRIADYMRPYFS